jgi:hypothetical protein
MKRNVLAGCVGLAVACALALVGCGDTGGDDGSDFNLKGTWEMDAASLKELGVEKTTFKVNSDWTFEFRSLATIDPEVVATLVTGTVKGLGQKKYRTEGTSPDPYIYVEQPGGSAIPASYRPEVTGGEFVITTDGNNKMTLVVNIPADKPMISMMKAVMDGTYTR